MADNTPIPTEIAPSRAEGPVPSTVEGPPPLTPLLSWSAPSLRVHTRSHQWYKIGGIIVIIGAAYGILFGSWTFSILLLLIGGMYYLLRGATAPAKNIHLIREGVLFEDSFTRWEDLEGFWMIHTPQFTELHLTPKEKARSPIVIQTGSIDPLLIKSTIGQFIPEQTEKVEGLLDVLARILKL